MSGVLMVAWSAGRSSGALRSIERSSVSCRGPVCGLRPVCSGSIWYIGLPATAAATGRAGDGEATATAGEGDGATEAAADGEGLATATGETVAGATDAAGAIAGLAVGAGVGLGAVVGAWA